MLDRFLDAVAEEGVLVAGDRLELDEVAARDVAAGQLELGALGVEREVGHRQVVGDAGAVLGPVRVERADGGDVVHHRVVDEVAELVDQRLDGVTAVRGSGSTGCPD